MYPKIIVSILLILCLQITVKAQEFNCKVYVNADQISGVDASVFKTMQQSITDFVNTRKWGDDTYQTNEKIEMVMTIVVNKKLEGIEGGYSARISLQTKRPIFNTTYTSTLVNYTDKDFSFKYIQYQPIEFNDNRVASSDALISNLPAVIAYYCYISLGLDYDSFALKAGTPFYNKALNIVNNAPENKSITGWKATESQRNRFWLADQLTNSRFEKLREVFYKYHRTGLDLMTTDAELSRNNINATIPILQQLNQDNPASLVMQFFMIAKSEELLNFMSAANIIDKQKNLPILAQLDVTNANKYLDLLKK